MGKKAASAIPKNHRRAKIPEKFLAAAVRRVMEPKVNIMTGRARAGPYFLPSMANGGAKITKGTKKMERMRLY